MKKTISFWGLLQTQTLLGSRFFEITSNLTKYKFCKNVKLFAQCFQKSGGKNRCKIAKKLDFSRFSPKTALWMLPLQTLSNDYNFYIPYAAH